MRIAVSTLIYSVWSFLSRISGFVRDLFLASYLGAGVLSDIFFIALKLPNTFRRSVSEETFNAAYIPIYGRLSDSSNQGKKFQFARKILIILCAFFIPFIVLVEIFMPSIARVFAFGISNPEEFSLLVKVARIIFPYLIFIVVSSVFIGTLNANNKFALASGLPIILNASIVISILVLPYFDFSKIIFLAWTVIIGGTIQAIFLFLFIERDFWKSFFSLKRYFTSSKRFFNLIWPTFFASTLVQISVLLGIFIASFQQGAVSYLYFAERVYFLPISLIAVAIATVLIPNLSNQIRQFNTANASSIQSQAYNYIILTIIPATFVLIGISDQLIKLLFERGEFNAEDSIQSALALKIFLIGLPAASLVKVLNPYFYAIEQPQVVLKVTFYTFLLNIFLSVSLFWYIGFIAVPLALSISAFLNLFLLLREHKKSQFFVLEKEQIIYFCKYLLLSIFLFLVINVIDSFGFNIKNLFIDVFLKSLLPLILWASFISIYDIEIRNLFTAYIKERYQKYKLSKKSE